MSIVGTKLAGGGKKYALLITATLSLFLVLSFIFTACSGGGSSAPGSTDTGTGTTTSGGAAITSISIVGTVDTTSIAAKPFSKSESAKAASPLAGAAVTAIGGDGKNAGSTTTGADGSYTLKAPGNATYVVKATSGNIVLKAIHSFGMTNTTVNVNPGTTVTVAVLEHALNMVFDDGITFGPALSGVNVNATVTQITMLPGYTSAANAAAAAIAANTNPATAASTVTITSSTITYAAVPAAPTGVFAAAGNGQVTVSWTAVTGAASYSVYYRTSAGVTVANGTKAMCASADCTITGLANGTAYFFIVTAVNAGGESPVSSEVTATPLNLMGGAVQNGGVALNNVSSASAVTVSTIAGSAGLVGSTDGTGTAARFNQPFHLTTDGTNLYMTDSYNHTIRQVVIATGAVTTLAGSAGVSGTTDGTGTAARFYYPFGITTDGTNLYVVDYGNHTIRRIVISTGVVTTLAGSAGVLGSTDGTGMAARFSNPQGITTDGTNLYVADTQNSTIRKIVISTGVVTTLAGSAGLVGSTDGTGTAARFNNSGSITMDGTNLYVPDTSSQTIRKVVIASGVVTTIAGSAGLVGSTDATGTAARFSNPQSITTDGTNLYLVEYGNSTIRKVVIATGVVTTLAGSAGVLGSTDGTGTAARFNIPRGITTDGTSLYVADSGNHTIRKIQ